MTEQLPEVTSNTNQVLISKQVDEVIKYLPALVQENLAVALREASSAAALTAKLKAIDMLYDVMGFTAGAAMPVSKQNAVFIQMLTMLAPQVAAEAQRRGLPTNATILQVVEGMYTEDGKGEEAQSDGEEK